MLLSSKNTLNPIQESGGFDMFVIAIAVIAISAVAIAVTVPIAVAVTSAGLLHIPVEHDADVFYFTRFVFFVYEGEHIFMSIIEPCHI